MIDRLHELESSLGPQVDQLKEQALDLAAVARERFADGTRIVREYVSEQPARALGIALGMGVLVGWLLKRR